MRIVVTGSSGFIGKHVTSALQDFGYEVLALSRKKIKYSVQVSDYDACPPGDWVIHLAEESDRLKVNKSHEEYKDKSLYITKSLIENFHNNIIYISSSVVYDSKNKEPSSVDSPVKAKDFYAETKLANEELVLDAGGCVIRLSNVIGLGMSRNTVVFDIIKQLNNPGPLYVINSNVVCDFISISDVINAIILVLKNNFYGLVNVGSGIGISVKDLVYLFFEISGEPLREVISKNTVVESTYNVLNIDATKKNINWFPKAKLKDELKKLLYKEINNG